jgi:hypothetical protein
MIFNYLHHHAAISDSFKVEKLSFSWYTEKDVVSLTCRRFLRIPGCFRRGDETGRHCSYFGLPGVGIFLYPLTPISPSFIRHVIFFEEVYLPLRTAVYQYNFQRAAGFKQAFLFRMSRTRRRMDAIPRSGAHGQRLIRRETS